MLEFVFCAFPAENNFVNALGRGCIVANMLCHSAAPEKSVRICLGGAFTKDTGQRDLVRKATRLIAVEGCFVNCSSRMINGVIVGLKPEVIRSWKNLLPDQSDTIILELTLMHVAAGYDDLYPVCRVIA